MGKNSGKKRDKRKTNKKAPSAPVNKAQKTRPTLGLAMIMKDEVDDLHRIVKDYGKYFNKIYVTATDLTTHDTLQNLYSDNPEVELSYFEWIDHFGKARNYNLKQVNTDYWMSIDLDDEIEGAHKLPEVVDYMDTNNLDAIWFLYDYLPRSNASDLGAVQWKVRIVRTASKLKWSDEPIHEMLSVKSESNHRLISESDIMIKHRKTTEQFTASENRNRLILEKNWQQKHRYLTAYYLAKDYMLSGDYKGAIEKYTFSAENSLDVVIGFDSWKYLCECYFQIGDYTAALVATDQEIAIDSEYPEPWYQKFFIYMAMGNHLEAFKSAETAMIKKIPANDVGIRLNQDPSYYEYKAPFAVARAYLTVGNIERAFQLYDKISKIAPQYIAEQSVATGVRWDTVFENAYREFKDGLIS